MTTLIPDTTTKSVMSATKNLEIIQCCKNMRLFIAMINILAANIAEKYLLAKTISTSIRKEDMEEVVVHQKVKNSDTILL